MSPVLNSQCSGIPKALFTKSSADNTVKLVARSPGLGWWKRAGGFGGQKGAWAWHGEGGRCFPFWYGHSDKDWRAGWCWCRHFFPAICAVTVFFYSATYGTFLIEFFIIIDLTCIILLVLAKQTLTGFDIRTKNMFSTSWGAIKQAEIMLMIMYNLLATIKFLLFTWSKPSRDNVSLESPSSFYWSSLIYQIYLPAKGRAEKRLPRSPCSVLPVASVCHVENSWCHCSGICGMAILDGAGGLFQLKGPCFREGRGKLMFSGVSFQASSLKQSWWHSVGWSEQTALTWAPPALASSHPPLHKGQRFCRAEELHSTQSPCPSILQVPEPQIPAQTAPNPLPHPGFSSGSDILRVRHAVGIPPEFWGVSRGS